MSRPAYYSDVPPSQPRIARWIVAWTIFFVLLAGGVGAGLWGFGVIFASTKGKGEAIKLRENGFNRVQKQEMFEQLNADIDGYIAKIRIQKQNVRSGFDRTNLIGLQQQCIDTVQQYNAEARKYTSRAFRSADLPPSRDAEECK